MAELSLVLYTGLGLPYPKSGEKLPAGYNALSKRVDGNTDLNLDGVSDKENGIAETEEFLTWVLDHRQEYRPVIKELYKAGLVDPLEESPEINAYVKKLLNRYKPQTELQKAILLFRAVIPPDVVFKTCLSDCHFSTVRFNPLSSSAIHNGLSIEEGGLAIPYDDDFKAPLRVKFGSLLPKVLINTSREERIALCLEYSNLLVSLLRAAGIKAHVKNEPGHACVIAELDGRKYKLDAASLLFQRTNDDPDTDLRSVITYYFSQKNILAEQGRLEESLLVWKRILEIYPNNAVLWNRMGLNLAEKGRMREAFAAFKRTLKIDPGYAIAWNNIGVTCVKCGKLEKALSAFDRGLKIDPNNDKIKRNKELALLIKQTREREIAEAAKREDAPEKAVCRR